MCFLEQIIWLIDVAFIYICVYINIPVHIQFLFVHTCVYTYILVYMLTYKYIRISSYEVYSYNQRYIYIYIHICTYMYICLCLCVYECVYRVGWVELHDRQVIIRICKDFLHRNLPPFSVLSMYWHTHIDICSYM